MKLTLIDYPHHPLETLYTAYRVCYSAKPVSEIREEIDSGKISPEQIKKFLRDRFKTGHTSPLRQLHFVFVIEGVSRALTAQFNRHVIGVDRCEMSQRYVKINSSTDKYDYEDRTNKYPVITPDSIRNYPTNDDYPDDHPFEYFQDNIEAVFEDYDSMIGFYEVRQEDARYMLPMGTETREQFSMSLEAMQRFLDVRLCEKAQWEIRDMAWLMYKLMRKRFPLLSALLGVKCWANRLGYCDEHKSGYEACKWSRSRPHKADLMMMWKKSIKKRSD